ncbi:MAG: hypothetical protein JWQ39_1162 [Glaciihabitans sp.]|nr:hypothetical protein [Glaciihabitans sp.]
MTVHRRTLAAGQLPASPDPFLIRLAGRHSYDRVSHGYLRADEADGPPMLDAVVRAYREVYPVPAIPPDLPRLEVAGAFAALWDSGGDFIPDFAASIESAFGIDLLRMPAVGGDFALEISGRPIIVVGETPNWFFQNWSIAHELGHILRGDLAELGAPVASSRTIERAANAFAAELLMPRLGLDHVDWDLIQPGSIAEYVWGTGVSTKALASRLASLKRPVSPLTRKTLALPTKTLVSQFVEADAIAARAAQSATRRIPSDLVDAHLAAVAEGKLGSGSLEWLLGAGG